MAKSKNQEPSTKNEAPDACTHTVKLAHPEELPAILTVMESDFWQLLHIVACKSGLHAAYFRKSPL